MKTNNDYLKIKSKAKYFVFIILYYSLLPFAKLLYGRRKNWLVSERGTDAQDNGFLFYKYLRQHHPEINSVFVIDHTSPDYHKVKLLGKTVEFGSFKHLFMTIGFPVKISSNLYGYAPWVNFVLYLRRHKTKDLHIYLEHGITKNMMPGDCGDVNASIKMVTCAAKKEYDYVVNNYKFRNDVPKYTGFARFDSLEEEHVVKNQLLFMPTWRRYLAGLSEAEFVNSDYYKFWNALINNNELISFCLEHGLKIKFYIHYVLKDYIHLFNENKVTEMVPFDKEGVQDLLKDSKMLVTDFSSVFFDFAYMLKPIVFYQFDEQRYNDEHYSKGYFDYHVDGFGPVRYTAEEVVREIIDSSNSNFEPKTVYLNRMKEHFPKKDSHNCDRIYEEIMKLISAKYGKN